MSWPRVCVGGPREENHALSLPSSKLTIITVKNVWVLLVQLVGLVFCLLVIFFFFEREGLKKRQQPQTLKLASFCLCILNAKIIGLCHHTWLRFNFVVRIQKFSKYMAHYEVGLESSLDLKQK
jgi:hypothetical protein